MQAQFLTQVLSRPDVFGEISQLFRLMWRGQGRELHGNCCVYVFALFSFVFLETWGLNFLLIHTESSAERNRAESNKNQTRQQQQQQ